MYIGGKNKRWDALGVQKTFGGHNLPPKNAQNISKQFEDCQDPHVTCLNDFSIQTLYVVVNAIDPCLPFFWLLAWLGWQHLP